MDNDDHKDSALLFSIPEACTKLGIKHNSLFNEINAGRLNPVRIGRRTLFPADELTRYVEKLKKERQPTAG